MKDMGLQNIWNTTIVELKVKFIAIQEFNRRKKGPKKII